MITVTESVPDFETFEEILGYSSGSSLFFDIETTGFSPDTSMVFLIGMLARDADGWRLTQLLAECAQDERTVLQTFLDEAAGYDTLVHFNGSTFDLPYLMKRAERCKLAHSLDAYRSVDLYRKYRPLGRLLPLERMNQSSLEAFLGWQREDRLTGKHMVSLFQKYAASQEPGLRSLLLLHNHDDMIGMTRLPRLAAYLMLFEGRFGEITGAQWNPAPPLPQCGCLPQHFSDASEEKEAPICLQLSFSLTKPVPAALTLENDFCRLYAADDTGKLQIPLYDGTMYHFFPDYRNYYYLPLEDQAMHKSVAAFVDKEYRVPAKAENCYAKKSGTFLPQPEEVFAPAFRISYESRILFFACPEEFAPNGTLHTASNVPAGHSRSASTAHSATNVSTGYSRSASTEYSAADVPAGNSSCGRIDTVAAGKSAARIDLPPDRGAWNRYVAALLRSFQSSK